MKGLGDVLISNSPRNCLRNSGLSSPRLKGSISCSWFMNTLFCEDKNAKEHDNVEFIYVDSCLYYLIFYL